jgi:hypothetical protein
MRKGPLFLSVLAVAGLCFGQDLCKLPGQGSGFGSQTLTDADGVLDEIGKVVPFRSRSFKLFATLSPLVKQKGGAAAQLCNGANGSERWIFYDPAYIDGIRKSGGDLSRYFVLAHETAHHVNGDTLLLDNVWPKDDELRADYTAAVWVTRLGAKREELLRTFDSLGLPAEARNGYPSRAERLAKVIEGYEFESNRIAPMRTSTGRRQACVYDPVSDVRRDATTKTQIMCRVETARMIHITGGPFRTQGEGLWWSTDTCGETGYIGDTQVHLDATVCP